MKRRIRDTSGCWQGWPRTKGRRASFLLLLLATLLLCVVGLPTLAKSSGFPPAGGQRSNIRDAVIQSADAQSDQQLSDPLEQGRVLYEMGRFEEALKLWQQAADGYERVGDRPHTISSRINQAQALKALGHYPLALEILQGLDGEVPLQPPTVEKAQILRSLGDGYRAIGDLDQAQKNLQASLEVAQALPSDREISLAHLSLGVLNRAASSRIRPGIFEPQKQVEFQQRVLVALNDFRQAESAIEPATRVQAELNQISLLVDVLPQFNNFLTVSADRFKYLPPDLLRYFLNDAVPQPPSFPGSQPEKVKIVKDQTVQLTKDLVELLSQDRLRLNQLALGPVAVNARINFARSLTRLKQVADSAETVDDQLNLLKGVKKPQKQAGLNPNSKKLAIPIAAAPISSKSESTHSPFLSKTVRQSLRTAAIESFWRADTVLRQAITEAQAVNNKRAEASAQIALAELYGLAETHNQRERWPEVETLSRQAMALALESKAADIAYRAQWQLARALIKQGKQKTEARAICQVAAKTLQSLRRDLVAIDQDVQFTFRDSVEPFYRECAAALLPSGEEERNQEQDTVQKNLEEARQLIESLQLAELDNFLREACLEGQRVTIDEMVGGKENLKTAFIYSIVLPNQQLGVIARIPAQGESGKKLRYYTPKLFEGETIVKTLEALRKKLTDENSSDEEIQEISKNVYRWLIQPLIDQNQLDPKSTDTLVFVLDEIFRNIPMAVLYDAKSGKYLIEDFAIAVSPGLQLLKAKPIGQEKLSLLTAGLEIIPENEPFRPLKFVGEELDALEKAKIVTRSLRDNNFSKKEFAKAINTSPFNVVHLATHGEFSSRKEDTFILVSDGRLNLDQFSEILHSHSRERSEQIELLVLSACRTAQGDNRAALGLAGIALKAGVRSTLASLWTVNDETTATVMKQFYQGLQGRTQAGGGDPGGQTMSKAKALQLAQLDLKGKGLKPLQWAPYVLVGNWL
ncbi:MAG: CHAT domain-containing protein [Kovacikia sp.]